MTINVAIDGPSGAGKSTIARAVAKQLGYVYVDTGALYRTVGWAAISRGLAADDEAAVSALLPAIQVDLTYKNGEQVVLLDGQDVSREIRLPESSMAASAVSALPPVRAFLLDTQRSLAAKHNVLMDGRDIGTVVLPNAQVKIFLTASPEIRARRRYDELVAKGVECDYETVLAELKQRDYNDSHRPIAPLKPAPDSHMLDTSDMTLQEVIDAVCRLVSRAVDKGE